MNKQGVNTTDKSNTWKNWYQFWPHGYDCCRWQRCSFSFI